MSTWRTGRSVGRTLYLDDKLVGLMDTPELATEVVDALAGRDALPMSPHCRRCERWPELEAERDTAQARLKALEVAAGDVVFADEAEDLDQAIEALCAALALKPGEGT